jgi:hypothetical protein
MFSPIIEMLRRYVDRIACGRATDTTLEYSEVKNVKDP